MLTEILWISGLFFLIKAIFPKKVSAHGVWVEPYENEWQLMLGEDGKNYNYTDEMVKEVSGYDENWGKCMISTRNSTKGILVKSSEQLAVVVVDFDYGWWSNHPGGQWVNAPLNEVPGATIGTHALKSSVNYVAKISKIKAFTDIELQIMPLKDPMQIHVEEELPVQVLYKGQPMSGINLIPDIRHTTEIIKTDTDGKASIMVVDDKIHVIAVEMAFNYPKPITQGTRDKICATLSFKPKV